MNQLPDGYVMITNKDLNDLKSEILHLKEKVLKVNRPELIKSLLSVKFLKKDLQDSKNDANALLTERDHWKARFETIISELEHEKKEKVLMRKEIEELTDQLSQQSQFCAGMGAASCTLLWRMSRSEESIVSMLSGTKVNEFLTMVASTLESYVRAYSDGDVPHENSEETQFILALAGILTNIAASTVGREFLMTNENGITLIEMTIKILSSAPNKDCCKLKNLILMTLYNISINEKGLKLITTFPGIMQLLAWLVKDCSNEEVKEHGLKLIQSLLLERDSSQLLYAARETLSKEYLQQLAKQKNENIKQVASDLLKELKITNCETST